MLETLTTLITPMGGILVAAVAAAFFVVGRISNSGAGKREEALKREVLDAKASVPQLESGIRNRDQQIARLQEEIADLNDRSNEALRRQDQQNTELRRAQREVKNLTSELNAVRGVRRSDDNIVMDGFEDEVAGEPGESAVVTQLKKTEALYEKLKEALIKRDARIEALEKELQGGTPTAVEPVEREVEAAELRPLEDKIRAQTDTIENLQEQLTELRQEKEMLEDLASRRSKSNRALKDATAEIEAKVPELEKRISERDETITAREASIKRLLGEVDSAKSDIAARDATIGTLNADLDAKTHLVETAEQRENALKTTIAAREERIAALDQELTTTLGVVRSLEKDLGTANDRIAAQQAATAQLEGELGKRAQAEASLTSTLRDRDFRIESLSDDKQGLEKSLADTREALRAAEAAAESVRRDAEDHQQLFDRHREAVEADKAIHARETQALKREVEDLQSNLQQHQQWMEKLKAALEEKESRVRESQQRLEESRREVDRVTGQLRSAQDARQQLEDSRHELEREMVSLRSRDEQIRAELSEHVQTLSVYKSMLADRDFRIESLNQTLRDQSVSASSAPVESVAEESVGEAPVGETPVAEEADAGVDAPAITGTTNLPVPCPVEPESDGSAESPPQQIAN